MKDYSFKWFSIGGLFGILLAVLLIPSEPNKEEKTNLIYEYKDLVDSCFVLIDKQKEYIETFNQ